MLHNVYCALIAFVYYKVQFLTENFKQIYTLKSCDVNKTESLLMNIILIALNGETLPTSLPCTSMTPDYNPSILCITIPSQIDQTTDNYSNTVPSHHYIDEHTNMYNFKSFPKCQIEPQHIVTRKFSNCKKFEIK